MRVGSAPPATARWGALPSRSSMRAGRAPHITCIPLAPDAPCNALCSPHASRSSLCLRRCVLCCLALSLEMYHTAICLLPPQMDMIDLINDEFGTSYDDDTPWTQVLLPETLPQSPKGMPVGACLFCQCYVLPRAASHGCWAWRRGLRPVCT